MSEKAERRLAAIVSADVVGYSRLIEADEEGTIAALRDHREQVFDRKIGEYDGRVANTAGDSLLIEFSSAVDALRCATEVQQETAHRNEKVPEELRLEFRIGINVGDVVVQGDDLLGDGVNIAARLQSLADPGGICISASVREHVTGKLDFDYTDLGKLRLKNIERSVRAYELAGTSDAHPRIRQPVALSDGGDSTFDASPFKRPSIIVMPFKDLGGADETSLAEGLRLSLHSVLIKLPGFFLLHTATVEGYRGQDYSAVDVGKEIDVQYVVSGAVQCARERVRVMVELTDTSAQQLVWGETYDRILTDIFDLQDEISLEIVKALDIELRAGDVGRLRFSTISNPSAREFLHRGVSHLYQGDRENTLRARRLMEKVDEIEPNVPACLGMIALTYWREAKFGWSDDPSASLKAAADYARRTIDLGDPEGVGHTIMGYVHLHQRRHDEAMASSIEAQSRRPSCPLSNGLLAEVMRYCGKPDEAIMRMKDAMKLSRTFPPWMINNLAASLRDDDQIKASISAAKEAVQLFPDDLDGLVTLCCDYDLSSMPADAEAMAQQILSTDPAFSVVRYAESQPYADQAVSNRIVESLKRAGLPE